MFLEKVNRRDFGVGEAGEDRRAGEAGIIDELEMFEETGQTRKLGKTEKDRSY